MRWDSVIASIILESKATLELILDKCDSYLGKQGSDCAMQLMLTLLNFNVVKGEMKSHQYFIFQLVWMLGISSYNLVK